MKTIHKYIFLILSIVLSSSTIVSQQDLSSNTNITVTLEIIYTAEKTAYAVDMNGKYIYRSTDGGLNWVNITVPGEGQIRKILFSSPKHKSGSDAGFEGESGSDMIESSTVSTGFMPADDFMSDQSSVITSINFTLLNPGFVSIKIYDNSGKAIDEITKSSFSRGKHSVKWNRNKFQGSSFYYSLVTSEFAETKKIENFK